jgi:hypothetical protein
MPRKTRRQLIGKQEDDDRQEREEALRDLEWELHLAWAIGDKKLWPEEVELTEHAVSQPEAKIMLLTVLLGTDTRQK